MLHREAYAANVLSSSLVSSVSTRIMATDEGVHSDAGTAGERTALLPVAELKDLMKQSLVEVLTENPAILSAAVESAPSGEYTDLFPLFW